MKSHFIFLTFLTFVLLGSVYPQIQVLSSLGEMYNLQRGYTYTLNVNPADSISVTPQISGEEEGYPVRFVIVADSGRHLRVSFDLPDSLFSDTDPVGVILTTFDPSVIQPITYTHGNVNDTITLGITVSIPAAALYDAYAGKFTIAVTDTDNLETQQVSADFYVGIKKPFRFTLEPSEGVMDNLQRNHLYRLDANIYADPTITPQAGGSESGSPATFLVTADPEDSLEIRFELPPNIHGDYGLPDSLSFTVDSLSAFRELNQERWDPSLSHTIIVDTTGIEVFYLGGILDVLQRSSIGNYRELIRCSITNISKGVSIRDSIEFLVSVTGPSLLSIETGEALLENLHQGMIYRVIPDPGVSPSINPITDAEAATPATIIVRGDSGMTVQMSFVLPSLMLGETGTISCSFDSASLYYASTGESVNPNAPFVFTLDSTGIETFYIGITTTISPYAYPENYEGSAICSIQEVAPSGFKSTPDAIITFQASIIGSPLTIQSDSALMFDLSKGITYTLEPDSSNVTPQYNHYERGQSAYIRVSGEPCSLVFLNFALPETLYSDEYSIPCSFDSGSLSRTTTTIFCFTEKAKRARGHQKTITDPADGYLIDLDQYGEALFHLGFTVTVPSAVPNGRYVALGLCIVEYVAPSSLTGPFRVISNIDTILFAITVGPPNAVPGTTERVTSYRLHPNFPNPFNPSTTLQYELPEAGLVSMRIYSVTGEEVAHPVEQFQTAGIHEITWRADHLPSGIYFAIFRVSDKNTGVVYQTSKKIVLMK